MESCSCRTLGRRRVPAPSYPGRKPRLRGPAHAKCLPTLGAGPHTLSGLLAGLGPRLVEVRRGTVRFFNFVGKIKRKLPLDRSAP
jgi:hypothetical protein